LKGELQILLLFTQPTFFFHTMLQQQHQKTLDFIDFQNNAVYFKMSYFVFHMKKESHSGSE